jgi:hypothetical protein
MKLHDLPASLTLAALLFTSFAAIAAAGGPDRDHKVTGTLACGGNNFFREGAREEHTTTYSLRNYARRGRSQSSLSRFTMATGCSDMTLRCSVLFPPI